MRLAADSVHHRRNAESGRAATVLTAVSIVARVAILPVLVAGRPGVAASAVVLGSFALLYGQLVLPRPPAPGAWSSASWPGSPAS